MFVRELVAVCPETRPVILPKLIESVAEIPHGRVGRVCLWTIGEFCEDYEMRLVALDTVYEAMCPLPLPQGGVVL